MSYRFRHPIWHGHFPVDPAQSLADQSVLGQIDFIAADVASTSFDDPSSRAQLDAIRHSADWQLALDQQGLQLFERRNHVLR